MKQFNDYKDDELVNVRVEVNKWRNGQGYVYKGNIISRERIPFKHIFDAPDFREIIGDFDFIENEIANGFDYQILFIIYSDKDGEEIDIAKASCWVSEESSSLNYNLLEEGD